MTRSGKKKRWDIITVMTFTLKSLEILSTQLRQLQIDSRRKDSISLAHLLNAIVLCPVFSLFLLSTTPVQQSILPEKFFTLGTNQT